MTEQLVIVGMCSDPEPQHIALVFHGHGPVVEADTDGPEASDLLETQQWMPWVLAQQGIAPVGKTLDVCGQGTIVDPET